MRELTAVVNLRPVLALVLCVGLFQAHGVVAQGKDQPLPCPSAVPGTPEPEWFKGAVRPGQRGVIVTAPVAVKQGRPEYTPEALEARITGDVWLDARVDIDGKVRNVCVVKSLPGLDAQAAKAAKASEFRPGQQNGVTVPVIIRVQFSFNVRK